MRASEASASKPTRRSSAEVDLGLVVELEVAALECFPQLRLQVLPLAQGPAIMLGSKRATCCRRSALATESAVSACFRTTERVIVVRSRRPRCRSSQPTTCRWPRKVVRLADIARSASVRKALARACASPPEQTMAKSSAPKRATRSPGRRQAARFRPATAFSTRSPTSCPSVSLMFLKRSKSKQITAHDSPRRCLRSRPTFKRLDELVAVRNAGQRVEARQIGNPRRGLPLLGDVDEGQRSRRTCRASRPPAWAQAAGEARGRDDVFDHGRVLSAAQCSSSRCPGSARSPRRAASMAACIASTSRWQKAGAACGRSDRTLAPRIVAAGPARGADDARLRPPR